MQLPIAAREPIREISGVDDLSAAKTRGTLKSAPAPPVKTPRVSVLLDTNVLSELLRATPDPTVTAWVSAQPVEGLFVSSVTQAEMLVGARMLPRGKRRESLTTALIAMFEQDFAQRILPFDSAAVPAYVEVVTSRRAAGRPISQVDAQIAAIALHHGDRLATRNVDDFEGCGLSVVDPWHFTPKASPPTGP